MDELIQKHCVPCEGGVPPLTAEEIQKFLPQTAGWQVMDNKKIRRELKFQDFKEAIGFVNKVAEVANAEEHHPDIYIFYNKVSLELSTHAIHGLSENDFIVAAKIDALL